MSIEPFLGRKLRQRSKQGQLQVGITMIVVFLFIILLMFSLIFYFRFVYSENKEMAETLADQRNSALLSTILGLPEFRCSKLGVEGECLDASKLDKMKEITDNNLFYYEGLFGNVNGVWVDVLDSEEIGGYGSEFLIYGESGGMGKIYAVPVSVYYPDYKEYKIGVLRIQS